MTSATKPFLPISRAEMDERGWEHVDFIVVTGDAYVDHPSFGHAIVGRFLESLGFRVGIIPQPDWRSRADFERLGRPRLGVMVSAGNLDSMLANYSAPGKRRSKDAYAPGGLTGRRPDRATIVYCNRIREAFGDIPLIIGGIEASLRRVAHYDYWADDVRRSILVDSRADILIYGMAENPLRALAQRLEAGERIADITDIPGTCWKTHEIARADNPLQLPSFEEVSRDKGKFAEAFKLFYPEQNAKDARQLIQDQGAWMLVHNPPAPPLSTEEMDRVYALPYRRSAHPAYEKEGGVPALEEVRFGITSHRGCFGECAFCAIASHQGRAIQRRSHESVVDEARAISRMKDFKGYIHDVGGPTANFREQPCGRVETDGVCRGRSCLFPEPCKNLRPSHRDYARLLQKIRRLPGIKKVFVRSGLRYDYILADPDGRAFLEELCQHHVSGQLKIAPEHASARVLKTMRKQRTQFTERFVGIYNEINAKLGKKQFLVCYYMSAHPGCGIAESHELMAFIQRTGLRSEQVQEFTPTPGTLSTCIYHTGLDPFSGEKVHVTRTNEGKRIQRALMQYWMPGNREIVGKQFGSRERTESGRRGGKPRRA